MFRVLSGIGGGDHALLRKVSAKKSWFKAQQTLPRPHGSFRSSNTRWPSLVQLINRARKLEQWIVRVKGVSGSEHEWH